MTMTIRPEASQAPRVSLFVGIDIGKGEPMTWNQRIAEAVVAQRFTDGDCHAAASWATCKVGEMVVQRRMDLALRDAGDPADEVLHDLGFAFQDAVEFNDIGAAVRISGRIEARAQELHDKRQQWRRERQEIAVLQGITDAARTS